MLVSSTNRPRHPRKHQATPTDHANFNEFLTRGVEIETALKRAIEATFQGAFEILL
jgi:hypothetical protein